MIVTASTNRIKFINEMSIEEKIKISGLTYYVGSSSMTINIKVEQLRNEKYITIFESYWTMVALDSKTFKPTKVYLKLNQGNRDKSRDNRRKRNVRKGKAIQRRVKEKKHQ
jgi:acyl-CoA hydrolase